ncbi:serine/threonine protein kinase [Undibacterium sp. CY18W]|uniref:non-specific serine/threonine protein kinase n=1 Tax=Undibacterium hunanense TaxID=2762292 RepID=A0ABR6ZLV5_9BURK|nr:serine/threonine-protein kinase [Undibacterium hunanense]MBC3916880.1 serine/threonine protein kinase [Undibacterium hunanense]
MNTENILANEAPVALHAGTENCLVAGTRLNDFEITGVLGEGGFGIVYLAFDHSLQRTVAIKEYMPGALAGRAADTSVVVRSERHKSTFDAGLKSFINEARLLAQFDHPSLVKVYRFWEENKTAYMVMRYYDGHTLKDIVNKRPQLVTEAWLRFIFKQILEALDTLYKSKILHRDISPDNIIVQKNGVAVLLDFGSARQIIGDMTHGMTVILKPGYAPVEQYSDETDMPQGAFTDIYALAAVMYFAIMKTPPPMSVARVVKDSLVPLQDGERSGFSTKFLKGVDQALAIQPQDRPQSIDEFRILLGISSFASTRKSRKSKPEHGGDMPASPAGTPSEKVVTLGKSKTAAKSAVTDEVTEAGVMTQVKSHTKLLVAGGVVVALLIAVLTITLRSGPPPQAVPALASKTATPPATAKKDEATALATPASVAIAALPTVAAPAATSVAAASPAPLSAREVQEKQAWDKLKDDASATPEAINAFLQQFPNGKLTDVAQLRLKEANKAAAAKAASMQEKAAGKLTVKLAIRPWGTVFVDGIQQGASPPLKQLSLTAGKHKIRVTNPGFPDLVTEIDGSKTNSAAIEHEFNSK